MTDSYSIGISRWNRDEMISHLSDFLEMYKDRPISDNGGGQKAAQLFYSWYVAKKLKPSVIIESGVYKGQGTWAFENASPDSKIICIDPFLNNYTGYRSSKAQYLDIDFSKVDWSVISEKTRVLCFFDDHQNAFERILQLKTFGFTIAMFEDNYPEGHGDCLSLKKVLEYPEKYQILPGMSGKEYLERVINCYQEFPPIFSLKKTRWGTDWQSYRTNSPLLSMDSGEFKVFEQEMDQFTWINYVELK